MKILGRTFLLLVAILIVVIIVVYADGAMLPVDHSTTVTDVVAAPPAKVWSLITDVGDGASWRHTVKSVQVLPPDRAATTGSRILAMARR